MIEERYHHCSFAYYELPGAPRAVAFHGILGMRLLHPFRPVSLQGVSSPGCAAQAVQLGTAAAPAHGGRLDPGTCR